MASGSTTEESNQSLEGSSSCYETYDPSSSVESNQTTEIDGNVNINPLVPDVQQGSNSTCWTAGVTAMMSWKDNISYSIDKVMDLADSALGQSYFSNYKDQLYL